MKKFLILPILLLNISVFSQNLQLRANLAYPSIPLANISGYVDSLSNEYALVGTFNGLDIVDVTIPTNPVIKFSVPGPTSDWREVKTYRKFAYVTSEGGGGLTIIDMSLLPDTVIYKHYYGDGVISSQIHTIHALHCDTAMGFLYIYGSDIGNGNTLFLDLSDPWNPVYSGEYVFPTGGQDAYVHDGYALNDTLYEAHINSGFFAVVDVRNKSNPVLLATQTTPTAFTHNTWLSDNHKTLFTTDENSSSFLTAYDISDLTNIKELSRYQSSPGSGVIVHNTHILNDYAITSWYKDGVVITDVSRPRNPIEVGKYDTYPQAGGVGFNGCWGVYPFLPSQTIVASDIDNGLFVLTPTYIRGCYLEGTITDSITSISIIGANIMVQAASLNLSSDGLGEYRTGTVVPGSYDVKISKGGYATKTITGVQLTNGVLTLLDVALVPLKLGSITGTITDSITNQPIPNAIVFLEGYDINYSATTAANGSYIFPSIFIQDYTVYVGKWGYQTKCSSVTLSQGMILNEVISEGYYDDFNIDLGWTVSGSSPNSWERGDPIGTYDGSLIEINPEDDVTGDCGNKCFVTDNGGAPYNSHDVDNGNTILTSPVFDATIYFSPVLKYYRRYIDINGTGNPNDTMIIKLSNGITAVVLKSIGPNDPTNGTWQQDTFLIQNFITPTSTMQFSVEVNDRAPGNILEGAVDLFEITGNLISMVKDESISAASYFVFPNPFQNEEELRFTQKQNNSSGKIFIKDLLGETVYEHRLSGTENSLKIGGALKSGVYLLEIQTETGVSVKKIIKE